MDKIKQLETLMSAMWTDYCRMNPKAKAIHDLLTKKGELVLNDHIALRTFQHPKISIDRLGKTFEKLGYKACQDYHFKEKHLYAKHWEHADPKQPKVFISELKLNEMSPYIQKVAASIIDQIPDTIIEEPTFLTSGTHWEKSYSTFTELAKESEYASWFYAHGFRPNHFTVNINELKGFPSIEDLNQFLKDNGHLLNASGGEIKGTAEQMLEQSSTMAEKIHVEFSDGNFEIPACYYEFAKRYNDKTGKLYTGFIAASADKIFESTNKY